MYCKKCGTKQKEGQKFCPKCGMPFLVMEKPRSVAPVNDITTEKAEDTIEQGKSFVKEDVEPLHDKGIEELNSTAPKAKTNQTIEVSKGFDVKKMNKKHWIYTGIGCVVLFIGSLFFCLFLLFACNGCGGNSLEGGVGSINNQPNNETEEKVLLEMAHIRSEIGSILPQVEILYNAHQQHMAQGFPYASSPAWGKWQDLNKRIDDLWDEYIRLARQLDDSSDIIEEAKESKRKQDKAFNDMFGPHY